MIQYDQWNIVEFIKDKNRTSEQFQKGNDVWSMMKESIGQIDLVYAHQIGVKRSPLHYLDDRFTSTYHPVCSAIYSRECDLMLSCGALSDLKCVTHVDTFKNMMAVRIRDKIMEIVDGNPVDVVQENPTHCYLSDVNSVENGADNDAAKWYLCDTPVEEFAVPYNGDEIYMMDVVDALCGDYDEWVDDMARKYIAEEAEKINYLLARNQRAKRVYKEMMGWTSGEYWHKRNLIRAVKEYVRYHANVKTLTVTVSDGDKTFTGKMGVNAFQPNVKYPLSPLISALFFEMSDYRRYSKESCDVNIFPSSITRITHGKYEVYSKEEN